ncbi:CheR family methyltransferase [Falsirhodobacter sp. 20TX0035]|uniref:CheR family methyltransferase n=1 Tax=Falsirhodobacter sp. 20TX0035 TaxID=3022019 RepID=UPI00233141AA|nr:CheR family methyltransferase [Falsirhodobacter sp. 20TX0035]MDB6453351.1 chemotaxis protein CheB [Falsirhodobacter sp. 20TX0035]
MVLVDKEERRRGIPLTPVCAIGASAGGVRALQRFFHKIDDNLGLAYVVIIHLSPEHDSALSEILAGRTAMPVRQVGDTPTLEPNCVYVIAPDCELVIEGNGIRSRPFTEPRGKRAPIDLFFQSIASARGDGIAVVLSGAGSDGALGVRQVKEAGGVIFVQDPGDAEFSMMPRSAIASGVADFVEPIDKMVDRIAEVSQSKEALRRIGEGEAEDDLRRILSFLHARTGYDFSSYKRATVLRRVTRRMQVNRMISLAAYADYLRENPEEAQDLFGDLLISVTAFFRDPTAFDALLKEAIVPLFDSLVGDQKLRLWSVGCATGEEAYSLAILMLEEAERRQVTPNIQIFATDLDDGALATAREGRYPKSIEADVSEDRLRRFFVDDGSHYRIRKEVRDMVLFAHHSALKDPPFMHIDLVTCRNLLIYLERDMQRQLLALFHYALRPRAYLFLGSAESIDTRPEFFTACDREARVYLAKPRVDRRGEMLTQLPREHQPYSPLPRPALDLRERAAFVPPLIHKAALEESAPPSALVDEEHRVLNLSRNAGRYIRPPEGPLSNFLPDIVLPELRAELRRALHRALDAKEATLTLPVAVAFDGAGRRVVMHVSRHVSDERGAPQSLVLFMDGGPVTEATAVVDESSPGIDHLRRVEEELRITQERLSTSRREHESAIQELRVANEELQSINEEYRSTAEELETSKEELQSINEELSTVNSELKTKLDTIASAHSDLQNLINATEIGTLFLDTKLRIKMLTPAVEQLFSVTDSDVGRPISDFTHKLVYDGLERDAARVLRDLAPFEAEVATRTKGWLMMRLRPYRTVDDRIEGVVLSFVDISARREAEERLRQSEDRYRRLFEAMDEGYILAEAIRDEDGTPKTFVILDANPSAYRLLQAELKARHLARSHASARQDWWTLAERVLASGETERLELWDGVVRQWFEVSASNVDENRVAVLFQDITERKRHTDERELLVGELNHRVKNMLAVVQSIARQTLRSTDRPEAFTDSFSKRLEALARAHSILTQDHWRGSDLRELATATLQSFSSEAEQKLVLDGPPAFLSPNATISFAMALHELATNAVKYGALSSAAGLVSLNWAWTKSGDERRLIFAWKESGGPTVVPPTRRGFGGRLLTSVARELSGTATLSYAPEGFSCVIDFPAERPPHHATV